MADRQSAVMVIGPLLRGLTFDGEAGAFVAFHPEGAAGTRHAPSQPGALLELDLPESGAFAEAHELAAAVEALLIPAFRTFEATHASAPKELLVRGVGSFSIEPRRPPAERSPFRLPDRNRLVAGRVALVTGGAQGFGEEIVRYLHGHGMHVFIADLNLAGAERLAGELDRAPAGGGADGAAGARAFAVKVDISSEESVQAMAAQVAATSGGIDLLVSNAGVLKAGSVKELAATDFQLVTAVNYTGYFLCVKHFAPLLALQNRPSGAYFTDIIQINSKSGLEGSNKNGAYAGSKFGGIGLTQSFALELVGDNIKVNAVCPGNFLDGPLWSDPDRGLFVQYLRAGKVPGAKSVADVRRYYEGRVPMGRGCTGEDVAKAIFYIIEQKYETGQAVPVTGGQVMLS